MSIIPPLRITMSGGGMKGLAHIGALEVLAEKGILRTVREYIGISAGALCAFCMCVGCSVEELRVVTELLDFSQVQDLEVETMAQFPETFGLDTGANLEKLIKAILRAKGLAATITFAELAAQRPTLPRLRMFATNLNTCRVMEFSAAATPAFEVCLGLRASMAIPLYFQPVVEPVTGHLLVDGGVVWHSPFKFLNTLEKENTIAITFANTHKTAAEIQTLPAFLLQLYYTLDYEHNVELVEPWSHNTIFLETGYVNSVYFNMGAEAKVALIEAGRKSAEQFLKRGVVAASRASTPRRYSVG